MLIILVMGCSVCYQEVYAGVVEYYGENPRTLPPTTFFSLFVRFSKAFKVGDVSCSCRASDIVDDVNDDNISVSWFIH